MNHYDFQAEIAGVPNELPPLKLSGIVYEEHSQQQREEEPHVINSAAAAGLCHCPSPRDLYAKEGDTLLGVAEEAMLYLSQLVAGEKSDVNVYVLYRRLSAACSRAKTDARLLAVLEEEN